MHKTKIAGAFLALLAVPTATMGCAEPAHATTTLTDAILSLTIASENRDGYERGQFPHWFDDDQDGCDTRREVLIAEADRPTTISGVCMISGGSWRSYYDGKEVTDPRKLDIDHLVPLAEAWDSGAHAWSRDRRRAFANDLDDERSLVAVTAATNRSKADQDPFTWMPPSAEARCRYVAEWTATKLRWSLSVDGAERQALLNNAAGCDPVFPDVVIFAA